MGYEAFDGLSGLVQSAGETSVLCCFAVLTMSLAPVSGLCGHSQVPWEACELSWSLNPMEGIVVVSRAMGLSQCAARTKQLFSHPLSCVKESGFPWSAMYILHCFSC